MGKFISLENLCFSYEKNQSKEKSKDLVLDNINLCIEKKELIAIVGANGSGKSTLSKILNGILVPTDGVLFVEGVGISKKETVFSIRKNTGLVFQDPDNQIVATVVEEDVAFGLENLSMSRDNMKSIVFDSLKSVDMLEYRKNLVEKLSGGQKNKITVAGVIAMNPKCIIFDEATAMLDPKSALEILNIMKKLNKENGTTIINITHKMEEVEFFDRVIVLKGGKILKQGSPREVFSNSDILKQAGLCLPQAAELIDILHREGIVEENVAVSVDECVDVLADLFERRKIFGGN